VRAWFGVAFLAVVMALVLFFSAGTTDYWEAWVYLDIFFGASILITIYLIREEPTSVLVRLPQRKLPPRRNSLAHQDQS
jgi:ABC-type arginine/histidine transport system permease subunit